MKRIISLFIFTFILSLCSNASADTKADIDFGMDAEDVPTVSVSGRLEGERAGFSLVNYQIISCGDITDDIEGAYALAKEKLMQTAEGEDMSSVMAEFGTVLCDSEGNYSFSWKQKAESGIYGVMIYAENSSEPYYYIYTYLNPDELKELLLQLGSAGKAELTELIDSNYRKLNLDISVYETLNKEKVCELIVSLKDESFDSLAEFDEIFKTAVLIREFNEAQTASEVKALAEKDGGVFDISQSPFYPTFSKQDDEVKNKVYASLANGSFKASEEIAAAFCEKGFLTVNANISYWSEMREFITDNAGWLGLDLSEYEKSETKAKAADKALVKKSFDSVDEWKSTFKNALDDADEDDTDTKKPSSGKGSSGGGGGGYSGVSLTPITTDIKPPEPESEPAVSSFTDMESHPWAQEAVEALASEGIITGYSDGSFCPENKVTRAEFVKMAAVAFDLVKGGARSSFDDVSKNDWHYDYISGAFRAGVVTGRSESLFCPDETVTRQEMAVILSRTAQYKGIELTALKEKKVFTDEAEIAPYAAEAVLQMQLSGIIEGTQDGSFKPELEASRAEAAVMIYRMSKFFEG